MGINTKLVTTNELLASLIDNITLETSPLINNLIAINTNLEAIHTDILTLDEHMFALSTFLQDTALADNFTDPASVFSWLFAIRECVCALVSGVPPDTTSPDGCETPLPSDPASSVAVAGWDNRVFAVWVEPLPQGLNTTTFLDPPTGAEYSVTAPGSIKIWVQSARAGTFSIDPEGTTAYPTNQWVPFTGSIDIAVSVQAGADILAFLCIPAGLFDCTERESAIVSQDVVADPGGEFISTNRFALIDGIGGTLTNTITAQNGDVVVTLDRSDVALAVDAVGWQVRRVSGAAMRAAWVSLDDDAFGSMVWTTSETDLRSIPESTTFFWVDNNDDSSASNHSGTFTVEICPPGE